MHHRDPGVLDGSVMLFGGAYSNVQALDAPIKTARTRGIEGPQRVNADVTGMPPNDGTRDTRFAMLENGHVRNERLRYDAKAAAADMARAGLPAGYRDGLLTGYWPSEDVLPDALRVSSLASG